MGVMAAAAGTRLTLDNVVIRVTRAGLCADSASDTCRVAGHGLGSYESALIEISSFAVSDNALAGIQLAYEGGLEARAGVVSGNVVGVDVQVAGFELDEYFEQVLLRNNEEDVSTTELSIPEALEAGAAPGTP